MNDQFEPCLLSYVCYDAQLEATVWRTSSGYFRNIAIIESLGNCHRGHRKLSDWTHVEQIEMSSIPASTNESTELASLLACAAACNDYINASSGASCGLFRFVKISNRYPSVHF